MIRSSHRGIVAAILGVSALLLVAGLVFATTGAEPNDESDASDNDAAIDLPLVPGASPTAAAVVTDPAPVAKPTEVPGSGGGSSGSNGAAGAIPPDAPRGSQPIAPTDPGNASGPVSKDPRDVPVSSPPGGGSEPSPVPPAPSIPPAGGSPLPKSDLPPLPAGSSRVEAPIDGLDVLTLESAPPQYMLKIQAGLPSGCAQKAGYEASRSGNTITVKVYNLMPQGATICTMIYGMYDLNIALGSDFVSGQTYTVRVNDKTTTFKAQ